MVEERGRARPELAPPGVLTVDEAIELCDWACRYGAIHWTREPAPGNKLRRFYPVAVPLVEEFSRREVSGLIFWRQRAAARVGSDR